MNKINNKTVLVSTSSELKDALENDNGYEYIYLENDITLDSGITVNKNKNSVTINGTYQNVMHTLTGMNSVDSSDTIVCISSSQQIKIKNIKIIYTNTNGVVYVSEDNSSYNTITIYDNVTFTGTQLSVNPYGVVKIDNSNITIQNTNNVESQEVCEAERIIIGGKTNITSNSTNFSLFYFKEDSVSPYIVFSCKSNVIISTDTREFMSGTNKLNFTILHDTSVHLTTGNGFANLADYGANNVLIDERASFIFLEKSHERIPMWAIFGSLTMKEASTLQIINSYNNTPSDNFNIHFKGTDCSINLDNPKNLTIYTKNSNVLYTDNALNFNIKCSRINMWQNSSELSQAGDINNLPDYYWYKENDLTQIVGVITSSITAITHHNIISAELQTLSDIGLFAFQNRKQLSIGTTYMNIHPVNTSKNTISGHTDSFADVLIKYNSTSEIVNADDNGLFEYNLPSTISDNTKVELTSNVSGSFIYKTRTIMTPFTGELTLLDANPSIDFSFVQIGDTYIFPKVSDLKTKIVDSRLSSSDWKLCAYINNPLTSSLGYTLENALVFKKFDDETIILTSTPTIVYTGKNNEGIVNFEDLNWSKEKGPLLDLTNDALVTNEEYFATIYFYIEE